jgi:ribosomal-protein-alanine N-acetyltransferase
MKMIQSFETARIRARRVTPGDLEELASMYQNPLVMETLGGEKSREQTLQSLEKMIKHMDQHGFSYWILEEKQSHTFMGRAGLLHTEIDGSHEVELGYALLPEFWSKGLATEAAKEIIRIAFEEFKLDNIVCFSLPGNMASLRVMEKLGFSFEKKCVYKELPHVLYRLTADQWRGEG